MGSHSLDLGLYFGGEEDDTQLDQEDKNLSYLELSNEQDDSYDVIDTETLLAEMSSEPSQRSNGELNVDTDVVQMFGDPELPPVEKARLLSKSDYDFHRAFLAREVVTLLPSMDIGDAISSIVPIVRELSADSQESVRESLASQLDKIVLYFYQNAIITDEKALTDTEKETKDANTPHQPSNSAALAHNTFTPIFINLLLDQNAAIAHQTREAVRSVAENCREDLLESEVLDGVIAGLEKLYNNSSASELKQGLNMNGETDQDGEAELGKMLVVVLLTSLAKTLGKDRCTQIVLPKLEKLMSNSQFFVRKEIVIALGTLCKVVDQRVVIDKLLPLYDTFVHDDTWHIRRACCTVLASFVSSLPVEMKTKKVEEIYDLYSVDVSRSVRNSIMEVLGEVIAGFEEGKVPDSLLNHFLNMGQQPMNEHELAVMCAFSFPAVILTAGRSKWEMMKPVYMKLAATFRSPIRRSLACSLHEVARILGPEIADRDLAVAFSDCLVAEDEVKEGVIGHVVEFISCLSPQCRSYALRNIYNAWSELERSSNWRLRDSLAGQLPALCEIAEAKDLLEYLMPLSIRACTDGVSTIRESGVMSFPALWEVSSRVGPVVHKKEKEDNDVVMEDSEDLGPVLGSFGEGEDLDMEDVTNQLYNPPHSSQAGQIDSATKTNGSISSTNTSGQERTTTIKEQVVQQTIEFINNGGFRSRVVAVQIIQSLLDYGIDIEDFEEHFLLPLVEQLATDNVVNVRIWVSRVITWIIESGLCKESANISDRLQTTLLILQKDPDRDVRIYAGGPAELPKPKKKKKSSKNKKKKKKDQDQQQSSSSIGGIKNGADRSQVSTINEEDENSEDIKFLKGEGDSDDNNDEDDDDDDDDEEEGESDEESSDDSMEFLNSAKTKGISNKPRNRNSLGIGMKVMVGNKLTVSGKEIRKPKTSWDYVHGEIDEDEDETGDSSQKSFSAALGSKEVQKLRWSENGDDDSEEGGSLFDAPRQPLEHDDDDDPVDPSADISKVVPYNARRADSASPLDVEMEGSGERVSVFVQTGDTLALAGQEPTLDRTRSATQPSTDSLPKPSPAPAVSQYPPLSPMSAPSVEAVSAKTPPSGLSYADSVKQDEANPKSNYEPNQKDVGAVTVEAATTPSASSSASSSNRNGLLLTNASLTARGRSPEEEVLRVLNAKLMATGTGKKAHHPVLPPPITVNTSRKASFGAADPGSPSYAAIVASGASSPHPGILPAMPLPAITAGSNMRPNMNAKFGSS